MAPDQALLTDVGSTKGSIVSKLESGLAKGKHFVGSHPLAGSEKTGVDFARVDLFQGRVVVITQTRRTKPDDIKAATDFWSALGATVQVMSPDSHDKALATTSHLPHLVASAVAQSTMKAELPLTAGGWCDVTRVAGGDVDLWAQILIDNRANILRSLARFGKTVEEFQTALESENSDKLRQLLTEGKNVRDALGN
jgi:prephenate dehydrogenase